MKNRKLIAVKLEKFYKDVENKSKKKKDVPGKFYKSSVDNKTFLNRKNIFQITNRKKIEDKISYWVKNKETEKKSEIQTAARKFFPFMGKFSVGNQVKNM